MRVKKNAKYVPVIMLAGLLIMIGALYLLIPDFITTFIYGVWCGIKAPIVFVLNIFERQFVFYNSNWESVPYDLGFLIGISMWSTSNNIINQIHK